MILIEQLVRNYSFERRSIRLPLGTANKYYLLYYAETLNLREEEFRVEHYMLAWPPIKIVRFWTCIISWLLTDKMRYNFTDRLAGIARELECPICRRHTAVPSNGFPVCGLSERIKDELNVARERTPCWNDTGPKIGGDYTCQDN